MAGFANLVRGSEVIRKGLMNAHDSWRADEIDDCLQELAQAEADCNTLKQQIIDARMGLSESRQPEDDREMIAEGDYRYYRQPGVVDQ